MNSMATLVVLLLAALVAGTAAGSISDICVGNSSLNNTVVRVTANETLQLKENCRISSVVNLTLQASPPGVVVKCPGVAFVFTNVSFLTIRGLQFVGCGGILTQEDVGQFNSAESFFDFKAGYAAVILCHSCFNLTLDNVWFSNSTGYALAAVNLFGKSVLSGLNVNGTDDRPVPVNSQICARADSMHACTRGILILFTDSDQGQKQCNNVSIETSSFHSNRAKLTSTPDCLRSMYNEYNKGSMNNIMPNVGALTIAYSQSSYTANVGVFSSNFTNNTGLCLGAVFILYYLPSPSIASQLFHDCHFMSNRLSAATSARDSWKYFGKDITIYARYKDQTYGNTNCISIVDSRFWSDKEAKSTRLNFGDHTDNTSSVFLAHLYSSQGLCKLNMENVKANSSMRLLHAIQHFLYEEVTVELKDISMIGNNVANDDISADAADSGLLSFSYINVALSGTCKFVNLSGPVFTLLGSTLSLTGEVTFENIMAARWAKGGAIMLQMDSHLILQEPLQALFSNNTAMYGGAIGSSETLIDACVLVYLPLSYVDENNISAMNISLLFRNNKAFFAGNSIYISKLYACSMLLSPNVNVNLSMLYNETLKFANKTNNGLIEMSSDPYKPCSCPNKTDSIDMQYVYPGQTFNICMVVVDEENNQVYSSVYIKPFPKDGSSYQKEFDWTLKNEAGVLYGTNCTCLNVTIYSYSNNRTEGTLAVYPTGQQTSLNVPVTLMKCPIGFQLNNKSICDCDPWFQQHGFNCSIDDLAVIKPNPSMWVGRTSESDMAYTAFSNYCPDRYCNHAKEVYIDIATGYFKSQCLHNRTGMLCGRCSSNFSSLIGNPGCRSDCSNYWLLSIIMYAVIGILLVVILSILRLTVAVGSINGIIFFANILNFNTYYFLESPSTRWLNIFTSWLNLNLGFGFCLFEGMQPLHSTYLGFVVPIYLWLIVSIIIFLSRYSQFIANLTGRSAVPVLATLIHLSYSCLLRLITDSLIGVKFMIKGKRTGWVWYYDSNTSYLGTEHFGLFLIATLFSICFVVPYTIFFTGIKYFIQLQFVNKFRPLVDAYCAPYKDKYRYWFGARLWILVISFTLYGFIRNKPYFTMLLQTVILVIFTIAQALIMPYKSNFLNLSELFFMGDCIVMFMIALHYNDFPNDSTGIAPTATNVAMIPAVILFIVILAHHIYVHVLPCKLKWPKLNETVADPEEDEGDENTRLFRNNSSSNTYGGTVSTVVDVGKYEPVLREPLIETS